MNIVINRNGDKGTFDKSPQKSEKFRKNAGIVGNFLKKVPYNPGSGDRIECD